MKYDATEKELCMIEDGTVNKTSDSAYIICTIDNVYHYLTTHGEIKVGSKLIGQEAYHDSSDIAKTFLAKWIKNKEVQEEIKIKSDTTIKRMNLTEFRLTIKENFK